jgi:hypothetical protein
MIPIYGDFIFTNSLCKKNLMLAIVSKYILLHWVCVWIISYIDKKSVVSDYRS